MAWGDIAGQKVQGDDAGLRKWCGDGCLAEQDDTRGCEDHRGAGGKEEPDGAETRMTSGQGRDEGAQWSLSDGLTGQVGDMSLEAWGAVRATALIEPCWWWRGPRLSQRAGGSQRCGQSQKVVRGRWVWMNGWMNFFFFLNKINKFKKVTIGV